MKPIINTGPDIGRNDPCPCGDGRKFKHCHYGPRTSGLESIATAAGHPQERPVTYSYMPSIRPFTRIFKRKDA